MKGTPLSESPFKSRLRFHLTEPCMTVRLSCLRGMAERGGFEPATELFGLWRVSKPLPSATRPPLRASIIKNKWGQSPLIRLAHSFCLMIHHGHAASLLFSPL